MVPREHTCRGISHCEVSWGWFASSQPLPAVLQRPWLQTRFSDFSYMVRKQVPAGLSAWLVALILHFPPWRIPLAGWPQKKRMQVRIPETLNSDTWHLFPFTLPQGIFWAMARAGSMVGMCWGEWGSGLQSCVCKCWGEQKTCKRKRVMHQQMCAWPGAWCARHIEHT